jgi:hypothetical protein
MAIERRNTKFVNNINCVVVLYLILMGNGGRDGELRWWHPPGNYRNESNKDLSLGARRAK